MRKWRQLETKYLVESLIERRRYRQKNLEDDLVLRGRMMMERRVNSN